MIQDIIDTVRLLFRKDKKPYLRLRSIMGFYPKNLRLYTLALMHKSVSHHDPTMPHINNERLEFLGDAVLGAVVADILYRHYGRQQEGFLTNLRSKIVRRASLNKLAVDLGLDQLITYSGSVTTAHNSYMNGNAFEAFFGAIYLDRGYQYCYRFMEQVVFKTYINIEQTASEETNYKSSLIEWCQKYQYEFTFTQKETREGGTPKFASEVRIAGQPIGHGSGYSKKESDQMAAKEAMQLIKNNKNVTSNIRRAHIAKQEQTRLQSLCDRTLNLIKGRRTLVFDLDGTLLNTLDDLAASTNYALRECGYAERSIDEVRQFVGNGVRRLIEKSVPEGTSTENIDKALQMFKEHYIEHCQEKTDLYPGIAEMLKELHSQGMRIAIVSNKLQAGVDELYSHYFKDYVEVAIGETEDVKRKPAPDMVNKALERLGASPEDAIYIGDSEVDVLTAKNASLPCISVLWGFRNRSTLQQNGACVFIEKPSEIFKLLT